MNTERPFRHYLIAGAIFVVAGFIIRMTLDENTGDVIMIAGVFSAIVFYLDDRGLIPFHRKRRRR